jgi:glyoxylase-like metal-dependent hydrolase (beta-lactamase superfamily II)
MEVIDGVHQVDGAHGGPMVIADEECVILVDTGVPGSEDAIFGTIDVLGRKRGDVAHILITHADGDHIGSLKALVDATGGRVYASQHEGEIIEGKRPTRGGQMVDEAVKVDHVVKDGDTLPLHGGIRVVETFGHTAGHVAYILERENLLIAGDALGNTNGLIGANPQYSDDVDEGGRAVAKLAEMGPDSIFFGHGPPIVGGAADKLRALASQ